MNEDDDDDKDDDEDGDDDFDDDDNDDDDDGDDDDDDGGGDGSPCYGFTPKKHLYCERRVLIPTGASGLHTHKERHHEDDDVALHTYPRRSRWT